MTTTFINTRSVAKIIQTIRTLEGGGFEVRRPFPTQLLEDFDPFLLLDHLGPTDYAPGKAIGAPDHPHRGFETVTYILEGKLQHKDSVGNSGLLGAEDVQWMTAGSGVVHSEMPEEGFREKGGRLHGFQLWVNLPSRDKMMKPRYQDIPASRIPEAVSEDGKVRVRVIAGKAMGQSAVIETRTPIMYLHYLLQPGAKIAQPVPTDFNVFGYVVEGEGTFGTDGIEAHEGQMVVFGQDGKSVVIETTKQPLSLLLIGGVPLNEPIARYGPFVMNTPEEIYQAFIDYQNGRMGSIDF
ncbi:pirin family protein [Candidatus Chlorohelix sp.]|uniref:pirin family protein n=1 Tax=Candidatus Chlorohelix sp. TaxID=3139201 RepID=UPI00304C541E